VAMGQGREARDSSVDMRGSRVLRAVVPSITSSIQAVKPG